MRTDGYAPDSLGFKPFDVEFLQIALDRYKALPAEYGAEDLS